MFFSLVKFFSTVLIAVLLTGSVYGYNIKIFCIFALLLIYLFSLSGKYTYREIRLILLPVPFFIFYFILGLINGVPLYSIFDHFAAFLSVFLVLILLNPINRFNQIDEDIVNGIIFSGFLVSILKIVLWLVVFTGTMSIKEVFDLVYVIFNFKFITLETSIGSRFHFPIDYLLPISLYIFFAKFGRNTNLIWSVLKFFFTSITLIAILFSYSRLLWAYSLIFLIISYRSRLFLNNYFFLAISALPVLLLVNPSVSDFIWMAQEFIYERYFGVHANDSDLVRNEMFDSLVEFFSHSPVIGSGLGSHASLIKFPNSPWNYELQTLSMLGQFGLIGFILIIVYFLYYIDSFNPSSIHVFTLLVFILWFIVNSINCFLLTSQGAIVFLAIRCLSFYKKT